MAECVLYGVNMDSSTQSSNRCLPIHLNLFRFHSIIFFSFYIFIIDIIHRDQQNEYSFSVV